MERSPFSEEMESLRRELQTLILEPAPLDTSYTGPSVEQTPAMAGLPAGNNLGQQLMDASLDGIAVLGPDLTVSIWNPSMERIFGIPETAAVGRSVMEVLPFLREAGEDHGQELL